jgi:hypothetical protein
LAQRMLDETASTKPGQSQYHRGAQDNEQDARPRAAPDLIEGPGLVETDGDDEPSGVSFQGGVAYDSLHAIDVERVDRARSIKAEVMVVGNLPADEVVVVRVAREISAVAVLIAIAVPGGTSI